jgi:hypothetical protein
VTQIISLQGQPESWPSQKGAALTFAVAARLFSALTDVENNDL